MKSRLWPIILVVIFVFFILKELSHSYSETETYQNLISKKFSESQHSIDNFNHHMEKIEARIADLTARNKKLENRLDGVDSDLIHTKSDLDSINKEVTYKSDELLDISSNYLKIKNEVIDSLRNDLKTLKLQVELNSKASSNFHNQFKENSDLSVFIESIVQDKIENYLQPLLQDYEQKMAKIAVQSSQKVAEMVANVGNLGIEFSIEDNDAPENDMPEAGPTPVGLTGHISPPNPVAFYYNKMPKCGSTTLHTVMKTLQDTNQFTISHLDSEDKFDDRYIAALFLADSIQNTDHKPLVVVKHHNYINFTQFDVEKPTTFNLIRDPILRWVSGYNFCRGGMKNSPQTMSHCSKMTEEELNMSIEDYVAADPWIKERYSRYLNWFLTDDCDQYLLPKEKHKSCKSVMHNWESNKTNDKKTVAEFIKSQIIPDYYVIGLLEDFSTSLKLFEKMMPQIFGHVEKAMENPDVHAAIENSKSVRQDVISDKTYNLLARQAFKYEMDVYSFVKSRFYVQVNSYLK